MVFSITETWPSVCSLRRSTLIRNDPADMCSSFGVALLRRDRSFSSFSVSHLKGTAQSMILPPATSSVTPVSHDELSEARNRVASATSSGSPIRPSENMAAHRCC
jgi:hypothetical protein